MTYNVSSGTLNLTHSLTHSLTVLLTEFNVVSYAPESSLAARQATAEFLSEPDMS